jgi:membrane-bound inhibitor of C-type lysozyme
VRRACLTLAFASAASAALATTVTIELPGDAQPETNRVVYACADRQVPVTYINTPDNQFAILDLGDRTIVTVNVLSGSGARYVGRQYAWWSKGDNAQFTDLMQDPQKPIDCSTVK